MIVADITERRFMFVIFFNRNGNNKNLFQNSGHDHFQPFPSVRVIRRRVSIMEQDRVWQIFEIPSITAFILTR